MKNFNKFVDLYPCAYCGGKGEIKKQFAFNQGIDVHWVVCKKDCSPKSRTFAVREKECAVELWNGTYTNIERGTKGD